MKILVVGASGKTGQVLLKQLADTAHQVTGLLRKAEQETLVTQFGATMLLGDLENNTDDLCKGFDAIFFVAGSRGKNVQGVDYQGLANLVKSAEANSIQRFLYIGSINTGKQPEQFVKELKAYYGSVNEAVPEGLLKATESAGYHSYVKMKEKAEQAITNSSLNYTILRAGLLTQESGSRKVNLVEGTLNAFGKIARENVASCFIAALENKNTRRKTYTILDGNTSISEAFNS
jgi:uncharacterized protein YbjT (DUF2867 family)